MFPEDFVAKQVLAYTERGDVVFDPFSGRGTTVFESLLNGRPAGGVDINPVAACVAGAKADSPYLAPVLGRLKELEHIHSGAGLRPEPKGEFFRVCFHTKTLQQVLFLRLSLNWRTSKVDRFIAAVMLGCLHGESHKTQNCLSNRMPRTISTKPDYSVRWWSAKGLEPPKRDAFEVLRRVTTYRYTCEPPVLRGAVRLRDARYASNSFPKLKEKVKLIVTSPPYLDTTDYSEDQWLRLWFLGGPERPSINKHKDDRHTNVDLYWKFLSESWAGCRALVRQGSVVVVRIGGAQLRKDDLMTGVQSSLREGFTGFRVRSLHNGLTTEIKNRQTNAFRPGTTSMRYEHDFAFQLS